MAWISNISWFNHLALHEERFRRYLNSTEDYLAFLCGPRQSHLFLPMALVYTLIFVVGVIGNFLVCLVILKHRNMKTPTNYYLFSLAISDLLVLLFGMPLEVYEMWSNYPFLFGPIGCYLKTALFETVCFASILSVTTVSVERYIAILHPFRAKLESTRKRALRTIVVLWVLSVLFALPNTGTHGIMLQYFPNGTLVPGSATCTVVMPMWIYNCIVQITSFLFYLLPMGVISVLYYLMGLRLKGDTSLEVEEMTVNVQRPSRKSVTKMLFVLVMVFAICWAPFHIDRLFFSFVVEWTEPLANIFNLIHVVSGVFFYLSSAVNPIIYNLLSQRFRMAFLSVISPCCKHWAPNHPTSRIPTQQRIFMVEDHNLVDSAEDTSLPGTHRMSVCSSQLSTGL
ncbi:Neuromedin-U receptor 2 [Buceros rhinoceros silvestris]|uniref:Neuromedin-U receptor 2 n=1 Tax=Buceros rhinoceros silvestris TaxID=175836 RepID=A0A091H640_BUCRH|nr:PREDICTED: neuromedin-U receptor 2 [Buceros rhinoceros silvestris]KFO90287.1 Neuromedin-U receptor 2 [Buceros rhinoceros silvestris]